jgi:hypothetical protein
MRWTQHTGGLWASALARKLYNACVDGRESPTRTEVNKICMCTLVCEIGNCFGLSSQFSLISEGVVMNCDPPRAWLERGTRRSYSTNTLGAVGGAT